MSFLIKGKSANHVMREGHGKDKRLLHVGPKKWVPFADLPPGLSSEGDKDVAVVTVGSDRNIPESEIEEARIYSMPLAPEGDDRPVAPEGPNPEHGRVSVVRNKHRR